MEGQFPLLSIATKLEKVPIQYYTAPKKLNFLKFLLKHVTKAVIYRVNIFNFLNHSEYYTPFFYFELGVAVEI